LQPYVGQSIKFRFREGTDNSVAATGWYIDDVVVTINQACSSPTNTAIVNTATRTSTPTNTLTATPTCPPTTQNVSIAGFAFNPQTITVNVGTTVVWTNTDAATHTSTSNSLV